VVFVVAGVGAVSFYYPRNPEVQSGTTTLSNTVQSSSNYFLANGLNGQPYFNASKVYAPLGFPKISYFSSGTETPFLPGKPNFTLQERIGAPFWAGYSASILAPVLSLKEGVRLAALYAKLDPVNYTLNGAVFVPGEVDYRVPSSNPEWRLYFAQIYAGYWLDDPLGGVGYSIEADVDALNGSVVVKGQAMSNLPSHGHYELNVSSSRALETVRALSLPDMPAVTKNGTVTFMAPLIVFPGQSPNSRWLNSSLVGENRLAWIINLDHETGCCSQEATFAVDAETGALLGKTAAIGIGIPSLGYVSGSFVFSTAKNMTVSQQTYPLDGSIIGRSGSVLAAFPDVLTVKPGTTASINVNVSAMDMQNPPNVSFSLANPFPSFIQNISSDGAPPGVSFRFSRPTLTLISNHSTNTTLFISVDGNAPSGTYFIQLQPKQSPSSQLVGGNSIFFFFSVWSGAGQWPPPPLLGL